MLPPEARQQAVTSLRQAVSAVLASTDTTQAELLPFWNLSKSQQWTKLGHVARGLLGIPAASTSSERSFSTAGWTVNERRTQLSGDSVWMDCCFSMNWRRPN